MILVTAATGTVGRSLVDELLAKGEQVRAFTRRPERVTFPAEVEVTGGDFTAPATFAAALAGVDRIFVNPVGVYTPEQRQALSRALRDSQVRHAAVLSGHGYDELPHNAVLANQRAGEDAVRTSGVTVTALRPVKFMSNAAWWADSINTAGVVHAPFPTARMAAVDPRDIAAAAAAVLTTPPAEGNQPLTGPEALSVRDEVAILSKVLDRDLTYEEIDEDTTRAHMLGQGTPPELVDGILELQGYAEHLSARVEPTVQRLTGAPPRSFRQWATDHLHLFR